MITSRLPPSRLLGSVATSIHSPQFNCFISTARRFFVSARWETMVFRGDPGVDPAFNPKDKAHIRVFYAKGIMRTQVYELHDELVTRIDLMGETGSSFHDAAFSVLIDFDRRGMLRIPWPK